MPNYLIIGAGSTVKHYYQKIKKFIDSNDFVTVGVNNVAHLFKLDYHVWTNQKRYKQFHSCIQKESVLILNESCTKLNEHLHSNHVITIKDDIKRWRTAGLRALQFVSDNFTDDTIYCVGFDGYSLVYKNDQHCYSSGYSDSDNMKAEKEKDKVIIFNMLNMCYNGVKFKILTPTSLTSVFYDATILEKL